MQLLKVAFYLQLLQNIDYSLHVVGIVHPWAILRLFVSITLLPLYGPSPPLVTTNLFSVGLQLNSFSEHGKFLC